MGIDRENLSFAVENILRPKKKKKWTFLLHALIGKPNDFSLLPFKNLWINESYDCDKLHRNHKQMRG